MHNTGKFIQLFAFIVLIGLTLGKPTDEKLETNNSCKTIQKDPFPVTDEKQNELQQITEPANPDREAFSRFQLSQIGTMMCYRSWEEDSKIDFHMCNVCFNETQLPESTLSQNDYITRVESCFASYLSGTEYLECLPMLRNQTLPNKAYDINTFEPPFDFPFKNFGRCAHGIVYKQEGQKCVQSTEVIQGLDAFLEKFACLLKTRIVESSRFSEANLKELLGSVPNSNGTLMNTP